MTIREALEILKKMNPNEEVTILFKDSIGYKIYQKYVKDSEDRDSPSNR